MSCLVISYWSKMIFIFDSIVVSMFCNFNVFSQLQTWWSVRLYNRSIALFWWAAPVFDFLNTRNEGADMLTENTSHRNEQRERERKQDQFFKRSVPLEINIFEWRKTSSLLIFSSDIKTLKNTNGRTSMNQKKKITTKFKWVSLTADLIFFFHRSVLPKSIFKQKWNIQTKLRSVSFF